MPNTQRLRRIERNRDLCDTLAKVKINSWMRYLNLTDWTVTMSKIEDPNQIEYNGETYFIAIERDFNNKKATIFHDINLTEVAIVHELLHIVYPKEQENETYAEYEEWIDLASYEYCENVDFSLV